MSRDLNGLEITFQFPINSELNYSYDRRFYRVNVEGPVLVLPTCTNTGNTTIKQDPGYHPYSVSHWARDLFDLLPATLTKVCLRAQRGNYLC